MKKRLLSLIITIILVFSSLNSFIVHAALQGQGTVASPYLINTEAELKQIGNNLNAHYKLNANIDLKNVKWTCLEAFGGTLDGNNKQIQNLTLGDKSPGLFRSITNNGEVKNLTINNVKNTYSGGAIASIVYGKLTNIKVIGTINISSTGDYVGAMTGSATSGSIISNCSIDGSGSISGKSRVGGIAGSAYSIKDSKVLFKGTIKGNNRVGGLVGAAATIENCSSNADVEGVRDMVGGLAGETSTVTKSYAEGNVTMEGIWAGGLVGYANQVSSSYATGNVTGKTGSKSIGGLVGHMTGGKIENCFALGEVLGDTHVGGILGEAYFSSDETSNKRITITNVYSTGKIKGNKNVGAIVGTRMDNISNATYRKDMATPNNNAQGRAIENNGLVLKTGYSGFDFTKVWIIVEGKSTPYLNGVTKPEQAKLVPEGVIVLDGDGTASNPFKIKNIEDFAAIDVMPAASYKLVNNIKGNNKSINGVSKTFSGTFDGSGYTVSDVIIAFRANDASGFFASAGGTIKNFKLENVVVSTSASGGGILAGSASGTIDNCQVIGISYISGRGNRVGGLVGNANNATITKSGSTASVSGSSNIGGLIGQNNGSMVQQCYATGSVEATSGYVGGLIGNDTDGKISESIALGSVSLENGSYVGGLIGTSRTGNITNCIAQGTIKGRFNTGTLVGYLNGGTITNSYSLSKGAMVLREGGGIIKNSYFLSDISSAEGKTSTQLKNKSTYVGWDFTNTWVMSSSGYPALRRVDVEPLVMLQGEGTVASPYLINDIVELKAIGQDMAAHYKLNRHINLNNAEMTSLGASKPFRGTLDGNNKQIQNLTFSKNRMGLFNSIGTNGEVKNLTINNTTSTTGGGIIANNTDGTNIKITNVNVIGSISIVTNGRNVGAIIGNAGKGSIISNCSVNGTGVISGTDYVGAIAGRAEDIKGSRVTFNGKISGNSYIGGLVGTAILVENCSSNAEIETTGHYSGGLAGNATTITNSYAEGNVYGGGHYVGGLSGSVDKVNTSYAIGNVSGNQVDSMYVGGLAGNLRTLAENSFALGDVVGHAYVGGIVGRGELNNSEEPNATIINSYASGKISGAQYVGGISGTKLKTATNVFYLKGSTTPNDVRMGREVEEQLLTNKVTYTGFNFSSVWTIAEGSSYAYLRGITKPTNKLSPNSKGTLSGTGTSASPYLIKKIEDISLIANNPSSYYRLDNDINGLGMDIEGLVVPFTGTLDGANNTISNINIKNRNNRNGLFSTIEKGTIKNLKIENARLEAKGSYNGIIAGSLIGGTIENCHVTGLSSISGGSYTGGLVGYVTNGTIRSSGSNAEITYATSQAGGLVGVSSASTIEKNYSLGNVNATSNYAGGLIGQDTKSNISENLSTGNVKGYTIGGLIGIANTSIITNCMSKGKVEGTNDKGALVGISTQGIITNSYSLSEGINLLNEGTAIVNASYFLSSSSIGNGRTSSQLKLQTTYMGWDFKNIWEMTSNNYPRLRNIHHLADDILSSPRISVINKITPISLRVNWSKVIDATEYTVIYNGTEVNTTNTYIDIVSLVPDTEYKFKVMASKGELVSSLSDEVITRTLMSSSFSDINLQVGAITADTVVLTWDKVVATTEYEIKYGDEVVVISGNSITIKELIPSTTYDFYIRIKTGNNDEWLSSITVTTGELVNGDGTIENPILLYTKDDIDMVGNLPSLSYKLMRNIDFNNVKFKPIGSEDVPFTGTFDGNGFIISNVLINEPESTYVAFFGHATNAEIRNLNLNNINITGKTKVALMVGKANNITMKDCNISNILSVIGHDNEVKLIAEEVGINTVVNCNFDLYSKEAYSNENMLTITNGNEIVIVLNASNISQIKSSNFIFKYDSSKLKLLDFVTQTQKPDISKGIVNGSDIEILSASNGEIIFKLNSKISNNNWSGIITIVKFKALSDGQTKVVLSQ